MKRSLVMTLVLSLAATLFVVASGTAQTTTPTIVRGTPLQVTIKVTPRRDRTRPYTFTSTGRMIPPTRYCSPGVNPGTGAANCVPIICPPGGTDIRYCLLPGRSVICSGVVTVRVQKRLGGQRFGTTISSRNVALRRDCTYRSRVTFHTLLRTRIGTLTFRARFQGNPVLKPRNSRNTLARAG